MPRPRKPLEAPQPAPRKFQYPEPKLTRFQMRVLRSVCTRHRCGMQTQKPPERYMPAIYALGAAGYVRFHKDTNSWVPTPEGLVRVDA